MLTLVVVQHLVVVHLVNVVAGEDEDIFRVVHVDEVDVLIDGVGCSAVPFSAFPFLIRRQYKYTAIGYIKVPWCSASNICIQFKRLILCKHTYCINT